ncbi:hypothetical protein [Halalkalibacter urbisdiaboli]|uniref:hypothetical protein n=1 Tax=Halalkalibacter urbisdiaboli TaxID=1960589 RepID=UPI000B43B5D8|nr:hypothetical protein [Halalkalibacter urbisdiaboli]
MYKGKVDCEANIYLYSKPGTPRDGVLKRIHRISNYMNNHVKITNVHIRDTGYDENKNEHYTSLSVIAEVLVKYDPTISHLNDYRVKACTEFRKAFPSAGAVMAHSIDTYNAIRLTGYTE